VSDSAVSRPAGVGGSAEHTQTPPGSASRRRSVGLNLERTKNHLARQCESKVSYSELPQGGEEKGEVGEAPQSSGLVATQEEENKTRLKESLDKFRRRRLENMGALKSPPDTQNMVDYKRFVMSLD